MTTVFLDTVGLLALWDQTDQWHDPAVAAFDRLVAILRIDHVVVLLLFATGRAIEVSEEQAKTLAIKNGGRVNEDARYQPRRPARTSPQAHRPGRDN